MREYIDIVVEHNINEAGAGVSRLLTHIRNKTPFFMISAFRGDKTLPENNKRNQILKSNLAKLGAVTFIETTGEYHEEGQDEPGVEKSFFVMPRSQTSNTDKFLDIGKKFMKAFDQDAVICGNGEKIFMHERDGSEFDLGNTATFDPAMIDDLPGYTKIKGRKFSFTNADHAPAGVQYGQKEAPGKAWNDVDMDKLRGTNS